MSSFNPSSKDMKFFELAGRLSSKSNIHSKHGCIITKGGKIVSGGFNHTKNNLSFMIKSNKKIISTLHSEIHALTNLLLKNKKKMKKNNTKYNLYVVRISPNGGNYLNSKPCSNCIKILKDNNYIDKVYYSGGGGIFKMSKINNLTSEHKCQGDLYLKRIEKKKKNEY